MGCIITLLLAVAICSLSWLFTCGIIKLICICFGLTFSWAIATGVWLVMILLRSVFGNKGE